LIQLEHEILEDVIEWSYWDRVVIEETW